MSFPYFEKYFTFFLKGLIKHLLDVLKKFNYSLFFKK